MVEFEEVRRGYSKEQVDKYLEILTAEYESLLAELEETNQEVSELKTRHKEVCEKNEHLEKEKRELKEKNSQLKAVDSMAYHDAIALALAAAEMSAERIVADAQAEARLISDKASQNLSEIMQAKREILEDIEGVSVRLLGIVQEEREKA